MVEPEVRVEVAVVTLTALGVLIVAVLVVLGIMAGARNTWMLAQQIGLPRQKRRKKDEKTDQ